jgi:hypothetical protein
MAQTHTWFGTPADVRLIVSWLREAGAVGYGTDLPEGDCPADGREIILGFSSIGPIEFWPGGVCAADYPEGSLRWRQAVLTSIQQQQQQQPEVRLLDADRSAVAGLRFPELREGQHWVSGCVWFPGSRLRENFPELASVCRRFERWLHRWPTVFKNPQGSDTLTFAYQLCVSGEVQQIIALPEAHALLQRGAFMVDHKTTPGTYAEFRRKLQLAGHLPL